ncbi:MAG: DUF4262 domain-containing protein [Candidatus Scalindua sp.]
MKEMSEEDTKALKDIENYGCHILNVLEDSEYPNFSYSIGIEKTFNKPEMVIVGLKRELAHSLINDYCSRIKKGEIFEAGKYYSDFLEGFEVCFIDVAKKHYKEHFGWANWLYKNNDFKVLQLIFPTTDNLWPWTNEVNESYLWWQRILNEEGKLENAI